MNMFLHVDLDAFFASVEQLDNPELKGKPVIVGGLPGSKRGVVSTCSYEARSYGVHSAMPVEQAYRLCPQGIYLRPRMKRYHEKSAEVMAVFTEFSPDVQQMSVDEAFVDLSGTERLFGPPERTALTLKRTVFERTGLTVSIGLAANKYVAKIASGLSKPDGFFYVKPGTEAGFMQSLPLKKVWGIGSKTLARLNAAGFFTVYDVCSASLPLLTGIFGQAGGQFLQKAVRGEAAETFGEETKSRSISAENTYPFDLTDRYVIGTALMDLAQTVMFRLLKEGWVSRTVCVKIRYDDFTTHTVQETSERFISSADDLYERASQLFARKYQTNSGVRLLGIGAMNLEPATLPQQQELFDFGEGKKRTVEKAILSIQEKNPDIPIKKARLFKKTLILLLGTLLTAAGIGTPVQAGAQETAVQAAGAAGITLVPVPPLPAEAPVSLFNYTVADSAVDFFAEGYWESTVSGSASATFGFGNPLKVTFGTPVFSQKVDLSLWFMLNETWYFEAVFADGFEKNTVAAGYTGSGLLKEVRLANRNVVFPQTYPADDVQRGIGGGENQAPGVSFSFQGNKWQADAVIRYDMLAAREKTYSGLNEVADSSVSLAAWKRTSQFVLPSDQTAAAVADVFLEAADGAYRAPDGRTYRKLASSEYLLYPARAQLALLVKNGLLSADGDIPAVAVSFNSAAAKAQAEALLGNYGTPKTAVSQAVPGSGFLGNVQQFFGSAYDADAERVQPKVASYSFAGKSGTGTEGFFTDLSAGTESAVSVLLLQHPAGFSPFSAAYRYDAGKTAPETATVVSASTGAASTAYAAQISEDTSAYGGTSYTAELYRIRNASARDADALLPEIRFPAADEHPEYYLLPPESQPSPSYDDGDPVLKLRTFTQSSRYEIGTKAVPGTVRVYKNGILDGGAGYDGETGTVTLSSPAGDFDTVRIVWYEENGDDKTGTVSAAAGFSYRPTDALETAASVTMRWPYSRDVRFADESKQLPGFAAAAGRIAYENGELSVRNTAAVSIETDNASGTYRILGMDDSVPSVTALTKKAASFPADGIIPVLTAASGAPVLTESNKTSAADQEGLRDAAITGYAAVCKYDFTAANQWIARNVDLGSAASQLASAQRFSIKMKDTGASADQYDVYLQLGVNADAAAEFDGSAVPSWKISGTTMIDGGTNVITAFVPGTAAAADGWQTVTVALTDSDRARLSVHHDARIVIVARAAAAAAVEGTLLAGPYETVSPSFAAQAPDGMETYVSQHKETVPGTESFNSGTVNSVQSFQWKTDSAQTDTAQAAFTRYVAETDISKYRTLNLFMKYTPASGVSAPDGTLVELVLDRPADDGGTPEEALRVTLGAEALDALRDGWQPVSVDLHTGEVSVGGAILTSGTSLRGSCDVPVRFTVFITVPQASAGKWDELLIDELYLKDIPPDVAFTDTAEFSWKREGVLLQAGSVPILSDAALSASGTVSVSFPAEYPERLRSNFSGKIDGSAQFVGVNAAFDAAGNSSRQNVLTAAGHSFTGSADSPVFKYLPFSETYRFDAAAGTVKKRNSLAVTLKPLHIPAEITAQAEASASAALLTQKIGGTAAFTVPLGSSASYAVSAAASAAQNIQSAALSGGTQALVDTGSYAAGWIDSTAFAFSAGDGSASYRKITLDTAQSVPLPFASFTPTLNAAITGTYKTAAETSFTDETTVEWLFPFKPGAHTVSLSWKKTTGSTAASAYGGNYRADAVNLTRALDANKRLLVVPPFYDLYSGTLADIVRNCAAAGNAESAAYATSYGVSWKRPFSGTFADFYLPSNVSASFGREIKTAENDADVYVLKAGTGFTSFNNFGAYSKLRRFDWYEQDEYLFSATAAAQIPRDAPEAFAVKLASYLQINLYFTSGATLKTGAEIQFEKDSLLTGKVTAVWQRQGKMSPLTAAIALFVPESSLPPLVLTRSDSINVSVQHTQTESDTALTCKTAAEHKIDVRVGTYFSVVATLGGSVSYGGSTKSGKLITLGVTAGLGGKVTF